LGTLLMYCHCGPYVLPLLQGVRGAAALHLNAARKQLLDKLRHQEGDAAAAASPATATVAQLLNKFKQMCHDCQHAVLQGV
jgi:hypothetical protein